jgi:fermentation-respiration switch protein FrsA (DUF1100 family)
MIAVYLLIFLLLLTLLVSGYCYYICFYSPSNRKEDPYEAMKGEQYEALLDGIFHCTRRMEEAPCQYVTIRSWDGVQLSARYYHHADGAPLLILFHGYRSMALRDSAGGYSLGKKSGMNVLAVDQRAHGRSGGRTITFGIKERKDCLSWIQFANRKFGADTSIIISGLSMGAATVLMATGLTLPDNVAGVIADCPYDSPAGIIQKVAAEEGYPPKLVYPFVRLGALLFGHFRLTDTTALDAVSNSRTPIPLIHGSDDRFVPCEMSETLATSNPLCSLHIFPNAGHGLSYTSDPKRYEAVVFSFLTSLPMLQEHMKNSEYVQNVLKGNL